MIKYKSLIRPWLQEGTTTGSKGVVIASGLAAVSIVIKE